MAEKSAQEIFELAMKHIYGDGVPEDNVLALQLLTRAHDGPRGGHPQSGHLLPLWLRC